MQLTQEIKNIYASMEEFAIYGYNSASTNNIAKKAEISKGVLFKYFTNKENLFLYICKKIENKINALIKEMSSLNHNNLYDILRVLIISEMEFFYNEPLIYMLYQQWVFDGFRKQIRISIKNTEKLSKDDIIYELDKIFDILKSGIFKNG